MKSVREQSSWPPGSTRGSYMYVPDTGERAGHCLLEGLICLGHIPNPPPHSSADLYCTHFRSATEGENPDCPGARHGEPIGRPEAIMAAAQDSVSQLPCHVVLGFLAYAYVGHFQRRSRR